MSRLFDSPTAWLTRRDGTVVLGIGPFTASESCEGADAAFYVQEFDWGDTKPWKIPARVERMELADFRRLAGHPQPLPCEWQAPDAAPFSEVFQEVMTAIRGGEFEKSVPVVTESGVSPRAPGPTVAAAVAHQDLPLRSYGWVGAESGFAGATPESLFTLDHGCLETMALAGTARSEDRDVFAVDEKEIREHEYVAQTLVSKLTNIGSLTRHPREILDLGSIVHFLSRIEVKVPDSLTPESLLRQLHPTPALGPLPRTDETMAKLIDWRRRLGCPPHFGAPFGVAEGGRFDAVVAIRGVWWDGKHIRIPSGCGLIEASRLVNEWRELRLKRESVKHFLPGN
ncbi:MAG: chorismate-binding protein [Akkermansiaceae bacterium]|nr:chorismate-binding protein [Akkermansiaceae bacterium]MCP5547073.1 chorismate-binding protein [Akkermansiaceae bacterium]